MSLNYLSSFFYSQKEELSDDELSDTELSDTEVSDNEIEEEEEEIVFGFGDENDTKLLEVPKITITEIKEPDNQRNVYKEYQTYRSKRLFEATKPLLNNFKFSFKRMMVYNAVKNKAEVDSAKEWMAAYKIQQCWKNKNRNRNKNKKKIEKLLQMRSPFVYFPF